MFNGVDEFGGLLEAVPDFCFSQGHFELMETVLQLFS